MPLFFGLQPHAAGCSECRQYRRRDAHDNLNDPLHRLFLRHTLPPFFSRSVPTLSACQHWGLVPVGGATILLGPDPSAFASGPNYYQAHRSQQFPS